MPSSRWGVVDTRPSYGDTQNHMSSEIQKRKVDHLDLCATDEVAFKDQTNLLEQVRLVHQSLPELSLDEIDTTTTLLGKTLSAPIIIAGMTGGTERAGAVNHALARIAEKRGYGFGLGSQRAMQREPDTAWTYQVREHAPNVLLLGNVGVVQARDYDTETIAKLVSEIGADALCVHMNPAMELVQPGGDRDFRGGVSTFARLVKELPVPVIAKETGNGVSAETAAKLSTAGVETVDVSGAGGTSWVGVETLRAEGAQKALGELLWDWGVPTAASVGLCVREGMTVIATGGIRTGVDIARAIALGATTAGIARNVYKALHDHGPEGAEEFLDGVEQQLRATMLLTGSRTLADLKKAPRRLGAELTDWLSRE
jgi:isopentenyl-diphosphate delta-isomerase